MLFAHSPLCTPDDELATDQIHALHFNGELSRGKSHLICRAPVAVVTQTWEILLLTYSMTINYLFFSTECSHWEPYHIWPTQNRVTFR